MYVQDFEKLGAFVVAENPVDDLLFEGLDQALHWNGKPIWKNPVDLLVYREIAQEILPTVVIETGTSLGGSAEFWRSQDSVQRVVTIDVNQRCEWKLGDDIVALEGSSTDPQIVDAVSALTAGFGTILVNLDSNHSRDHVLAELDAYHGFVTLGSYLIVEDGIDDLRRGFQGPFAATQKWLEGRRDFSIDSYRTRARITNCPGGYLQRRA